MSTTESKTTAKGCFEIARFLQDYGYEHVFGLPGSSMVSVLHQIKHSKLQYVPTIHESVTVAAADGYARVAGSGVAMIYMIPGTLNGMANLYNAWRDESPLIVLASQQDSTCRSREGTVCEGDIVSQARPFTRIAHELTRGTPVRPWLEHAKRASMGIPSGPAFLSICEDVYEREAPVVEDRISDRQPSGAPDISAVVEAFHTAERPLIVVGGQVRRVRATAIVEELSDRLEIPVVFEGAFQDRLGVGPGRSRTLGSILGGGAEAEKEADAVLVLGARLMIEGHPRSEPWFPAAKFVAHVNADPAKLEESRTADWSAACDPRAFAQALLDELTALPSSPDLLAARAKRIAKAHEPQVMQTTPPEKITPTMTAFSNYRRGASVLFDALEQGWVVDESVMAARLVLESLSSVDGHRFVGSTGGSLGWATGASVGVCLAAKEPVTTIVGDGSLRFGALALWTVAALKLPITLVVLDNSGYGSTRYFEREYLSREGIDANAKPPGYLNMDMRSLGPRLASMIEGFGIPCRNLTPEDNARQALMHAWQARDKGPNAVIIPLGFEG